MVQVIDSREHFVETKMAEPTTTSSSVSLAAILIALLGPAAGQYATIVFAALAGSLWPLSVRSGMTKGQGAMMVLRLVLTSAALTGLLAFWVEATWTVPATTTLAPGAFAIAAIGDSWRTLIASAVVRLKSLIGAKE